MVANSSSRSSDEGGDWLASLARQSASSDNKVSNSRVGGGSKKTTTPQLILSKAQRIERREQKRAQREERKLLAEEARQQRQKKKKKRKRSSDDFVVKNDNTAGDDGGGRAEKRRNHVGGGGSMTFMSKRALTQLSSTLHATVSSSYAQQRQRPKITKLLSNNNIPKGKATKQSTLRHTSKELQPRTRDYNGQGLARPSLFLPLNDPSFIPKLELEFSEHIEGFFGRSKTKAVKRQMVKDEEKMMLWQKRLAAKKKGRG